MSLRASHRPCYLTLGVVHKMSIEITNLVTGEEVMAITFIDASSNASLV